MDSSSTTKRILLLEDEVASALLLKEYLEICGYSVLVVHDGEEAINVITDAEKSFDLAILDIMVPPPDGYEVCKFLRSSQNYKYTPVIFLSAKDREDDEIIGLEIGADDYITKPAGGKLIATRVRKLFDRVEEEPDNVIHFSGLRLDVNTRDVWVEDQEVELTQTEFAFKLFFKPVANTTIGSNFMPLRIAHLRSQIFYVCIYCSIKHNPVFITYSV